MEVILLGVGLEVNVAVGFMSPLVLRLEGWKIGRLEDWKIGRWVD
jgi:hypothetical protein